MMITNEESGRQESKFKEVSAVTELVSNNAVIDNTDYFRSIVAISRLLDFPLDIVIANISTPTSDLATAVVYYLRLV